MQHSPAPNICTWPQGSGCIPRARQMQISFSYSGCPVFSLGRCVMQQAVQNTDPRDLKSPVTRSCKYLLDDAYDGIIEGRVEESLDGLVEGLHSLYTESDAGQWESL